MTESGLLEQILDRLGRAESAQEIFGMDEAADWPSGALGILTKAGLLRRVQPAQALECNGCERLCFMPVDVRPADGNRIARAFISCDKRDDIGRVSVEMRRLAQWKITGDLLAKALAGLLGFAGPPQEGSNGNRWALGTLQGKQNRGVVMLAVENGVFLKVGGHDIALADALTFNKGKLAADNDELLRLVDKPAFPSRESDYKPSGARREARKLDTQAMHEGWQKAYRALKRKHPDKSDVWCSQQIAKTDNDQGRDAETIRKHMKK